jgi:hypothetical protein
MARQSPFHPATIAFALVALLVLALGEQNTLY